MTNPLAPDLDFILSKTTPLWDELRGQQLFVTGGTGFFGCWLLESFIWANHTLNLKAKATILTRDPAAFAQKYPHLYEQPSLHFLAGDVRNFTFPDESFSHVIHAATDASADLNEHNPLLMLDTIIQGTRHTLELAKHCGAKKMLLTSSGAVYGKQPVEITHLNEDYPCQPALLNPRSAYSMGKCHAEHLVALYAQHHSLEIKIARCFAFVGPYLPLDIHFAIGNFIRDGLMGKSISVQGDGTPLRSYLYAADLVIWLWTVLFNGESLRPYNVGSDESYSIAEIAQFVAETFEPTLEVTIKQKPIAGILPERYVPDIRRAKRELQLVQYTSLTRAIHRTKEWYAEQSAALA